MPYRLRVASGALVALLTIGGSAAAQVPDRVSSPTVGQAPESALYLDPVFDYEKTRADIVYGSNVNNRGELEELLLDVWEPVGHDADDRPALVWISGGGFTHVSKNPSFLATGMMRRGWVVVSITYRVRPDTGPGSFGAILERDPVEFTTEAIGAIRDAAEDAKAAVRWVRANATDLGVDPDRIAAAGGSAGAITSLGLAFDADTPGNSGNPGWPSHVSVAVSLAGTYGAGITGRLIQPGDPPVQLFHGTDDYVVPWFTSLFPVCTMTLALGNVCEAHIYPGVDHSLAPARPHIEIAAASFLYRHVIDPQPFPMDR